MSVSDREKAADPVRAAVGPLARLLKAGDELSVALELLPRDIRCGRTMREWEAARAALAAEQEPVEDGVALITAERQRQMDRECWDSEHDDRHRLGELRQAAKAYASDPRRADRKPPSYWPWDQSWWKPSDDPVCNLVKAGALIAAEIDRLQRAALAAEPEPVEVTDEMVERAYVAYWKYLEARSDTEAGQGWTQAMRLALSAALSEPCPGGESDG